MFQRAPDTLNAAAVWCRVAVPLSPSCLSPGYRWSCTFSTNPWPDVHISSLYFHCVFAWWVQIKRGRRGWDRGGHEMRGAVSVALWDWALALSSTCLGRQTPSWCRKDGCPHDAQKEREREEVWVISASSSPTALDETARLCFNRNIPDINCDWEMLQLS